MLIRNTIFCEQVSEYWFRILLKSVLPKSVAWKWSMVYTCVNKNTVDKHFNENIIYIRYGIIHGVNVAVFSQNVGFVVISDFVYYSTTVITLQRLNKKSCYALQKMYSKKLPYQSIDLIFYRYKSILPHQKNFYIHLLTPTLNFWL